VRRHLYVVNPPLREALGVSAYVTVDKTVIMHFGFENLPKISSHPLENGCLKAKVREIELIMKVGDN